MWAGLLVVLAVSVSTSFGLTLPQYEDFSDGTSGNISQDANATIDLSSGIGGMADDNALSVAESGQATLTVSDSTATNVICHLYIKPHAYNSEPAVPTNEAAALYVLEETGQLHALSNDQWVAIEPVPTGAWISVAVHMDFAADEYDVFVNTNGSSFSTAMTRANDAPLEFGSNQSGDDFTKLTVTNSGSTAAMVDVVALSPSHASPNAASDNLRVFRRKANATTTTTMPPDIYSENKIITDEHALTALGRDMALTLSDGDRAHVPDIGGYVRYQVNSGSWGIVDAADPEPTLSPGQGILLERGGTSDTLAMYPYDYSAVDGSGTTTSVVMNAATDPTWKGYTGSALPSTFANCVDINSATFDTGAFEPDPDRGDILYFYREDLTPPGRQYFWSGEEWQYDGVAEDLTVCPGDEFIYYNRAGGDTVTWTVTQ
jgi:hypothetical protein